ncbi:Scr1 family TA system antitoxin-like transcriptional regulator [Micromonospora sp. NPDC047730]|uniref:Scr1 family TA system antitoxin-like transcriptional regulator n=1 Tax=Micromonospora sp. NPDC047730 TaxID=3364253 RepID=UPI00371A2DB2
MSGLAVHAGPRTCVTRPSSLSGSPRRSTAPQKRANVSLRVVPLDAGPHVGAVAGSFVILDFPVTKGGRAVPEPSVVYSESLTGALYLDKPAELQAYEAAFASAARLAQGEAESRDTIKRIIGEMRHD